MTCGRRRRNNRHGDQRSAAEAVGGIVHERLHTTLSDLRLRKEFAEFTQALDVAVRKAGAVYRRT